MKRGDIVIKKSSKKSEDIKYFRIVDTSKSMIFFKELSKNTRIIGGDKLKFELIPTIYLKIDEKTKISIENSLVTETPIMFSHLISPSYEKIFDGDFKIVCVIHIKSEFKKYFLLKNVEKTCKKINIVGNQYRIKVRVTLGDELV